MDEMRLAAISDVLRSGGTISREACWWLVCELKKSNAEREQLIKAMNANGWMMWEIKQVLDRV